MIEGFIDHYHAGHYFAGDRPDAGRCFELWAEAAGHLVSDMVEYADREDGLALAFDPRTMSYAEVLSEDVALMTDTAQHIAERSAK